jgi:hypothetical protein
MTNGIEEMLREGFDRLTADAKAPAGVVSRAQRRNRRRRIVSLSAVAAGAAVATAAAVITVTTVVPQGNPAPRVRTIGYVTGRAQQALATMAQAKAIEEVRETGRNGAFGFTVLNMAPDAQTNPKNQTGTAVLPGVLGSVKAQRMTSWFYHDLVLQQGFSATGKLVFTSSFGTVTSPAGKRVPGSYGAAYPVRTRWLSPITGQNGSLPKLTCTHAYPGAATPRLRATIRKALSCGLFALGGHQRIDGVDAIKLIMKPSPGLGFRETLWLDPSTYLPVRTSVASFWGTHGQVSLLVADYRWLPPTAANLAALHTAVHRATIPSRFRMLPPADLPLAGFSGPGAPQP